MGTVTPQLNDAISNLKLKMEAEDLTNNNKSSQMTSVSEYLFDSTIFLKIKSEKFLEQYKKFELVKDGNHYGFDLGDELFMRPLKRDDFKRNYLGLLSQLTKIGGTNQEQFEKRFDEMAKCQGTYFTFVIVDKTKDVIAGSITHVFERKFFRDTGARGRIEDVVVHTDYRGKKLSKILLDVAVQISQELGCYKLSLECFDDLKKLYCQFGFQLEDKQNYLCRRF